MSAERKSTHETWSDEELRSCVLRYVQMLQWEKGSVSYVKKHQYRELSAELGRSETAIEFRMQNISAILDGTGRPWIAGLSPARHSGSNIASKIEGFLSEAESIFDIAKTVFDASVDNFYRGVDLDSPPSGNANPSILVGNVSQIQRDPAVKAWVLRATGGKCEFCHADAPFTKKNGVPYLEVHHIKQLAHGGSDTVANAVGLCPNCHRAFHYANDLDRRVERIYEAVERLERE